MANPINNAQNNNKCPHGFPAGTCPICNGSMASSRPKDRNKPRVAGEMSYNECMAEWVRMQRAKQEKIQDKLDKINAIKQENIASRLKEEFAKVQNKIDSYFEKLNNKIEKLPPVIKFVITPAIKIIHKVLTIVVNTTFSVSNFVVSVSEKMAMVLFEIKNKTLLFIEKTIEKAKKIIKTVLSLFMEFEDDTEQHDRKKLKKF